MLPYWFSAMTMKAVGDCATEMMNLIIKDMKEVEQAKPNSEEHAKLKISTSRNTRRNIFNSLNLKKTKMRKPKMKT